MTVHLVAIHYGDPTPLRRFTESLVAQSDRDWRLVVVDNALAGEDALRPHLVDDERVRVATPPRNLGYLGGADFGLDQHEGTSWTVVSNTDLDLAPDFLAQLRSATEDPAAQTVGVIGPSIASELGREHNPFMSTRPAPHHMRRRYLMFRWTPVARLIVWLSWRRSHQAVAPQPAVRSEQQMYAAHGSLFIVSPEYLHRFRLRYPQFLFGEEIFIAENCRRAGLKQVHLPQLRAVHVGHASTGVWRTTQMLRWQRDSARANWLRFRDV